MESEAKRHLDRIGAHPTTTVHECSVVWLPRIVDERGSLTFVEGLRHLPFAIKRVYWIYDVPGGVFRGGHAYKELQECIIAVSGSFDVVLDDGQVRKTYSLNRAYFGLYVPGMIWREVENFSTNSVALILASLSYSEQDYIRDYEQFKEAKWR